MGHVDRLPPCVLAQTVTHYVQLPTATMALSARLQAKLDAARAERELAASRPAPRRQPHAFTRLHAVGVAFGLLAGGAAFLYGAQTPSNTLPPTPVIVAEPAAPAEPPALTMADLVPAEPVKCNPYASNGVYLPELCGEHDAFAARAARVSHQK